MSSRGAAGETGTGKGVEYCVRCVRLCVCVCVELSRMLWRRTMGKQVCRRTLVEVCSARRGGAPTLDTVARTRTAARAQASRVDRLGEWTEQGHKPIVKRINT